MDERNGRFEPEYGQEGYEQNIDFGGSGGTDSGSAGESGNGKSERAGQSGQGTGNYRSSYDSYRFREPSAQNGSPDSQDPKKPDDERRKKILIGAGIAIAGVLLLLVILSAVSQIARSARRSSSSTKAGVESGIVLGNQGDGDKEAVTREIPTDGDATLAEADEAQTEEDTVAGAEAAADDEALASAGDAEDAVGDTAAADGETDAAVDGADAEVTDTDDAADAADAAGGAAAGETDAANGAAASGDAADATDGAAASGDTADATDGAAAVTDDAAAGTAGAAAGGELTVVQVVRKVMPSMVSITNISEKEYRTYFGGTTQRDEISAGSGIIVAETEDSLLIATNDHVISEARDITAAFYDGTTAQATVIGSDADNDLAIVSVNLADVSDETQSVIRVVEIGDSGELEVGEPVVAIGNALGYGQSVSSGIVSALNRIVKDSDGTVRSVIQTDASINPGNSGGALLNMRGELIGINEAKLVDTSVEGVGYAIPMAIAEPILSRLQTGSVREEVSSDEASYLGITCMTMPLYYTQMGYPSGVYVAEVVEGGPADKAGLQPQDIITAMDGTAVTSQEQLLKQLAYFAAGEELQLSVNRLADDETEFEKLYLNVTLGSRAQAVRDGLITEDGSLGENAGNPGTQDDADIAAEDGSSRPGTESENLMAPPEDRGDEPEESDEKPGQGDGPDRDDDGGKGAFDRDYGGLFGDEDDDYGIYDFFR